MKKLLVILAMLTAMNANSQWVQTGEPDVAVVRSLAVSGINIFAGTLSKAFLSTNNGNNWSTLLTNQQVYALAVSGINLFAGTYQGVFLSTNNGTNWTAANIGLTNLSVMSLAVSGINIFTGTKGGVFLSTNNGTSWSMINNGLTDLAIWSLTTSGTNIFAGTNNGVFLSTNNGTNWTAANNGLINKRIRALAVSGTNLFAGSHGYGVFLSTNSGTTWTEVNNGFTNLAVFSLAALGPNLFAGTTGDIFFSSNNGTNWIKKNEGFGIVPNINALLIANSYIFAGSEAGGVWRRLYSEITGIQNISTEIPAKYSLSQNYPNPFNPTTVISFSLFVVSQTVLKVFDVMGREVQTLVDEKLNPGTYETTFDGSNYSSGVYFYRLQTENYTETKRMLLIK